MARLCFQIEQLPDLSLNKYQSLSDSGIDGLLKRHENFLRQWHGICKESNTSLHLLYTYIPLESAGYRLKLYLVLQGNESDLQTVEPLLYSSPLSDFYSFTKSNLPKVNFSAGSTLTKKECLADIYNPLSGEVNVVHYVPKWEINQESRLYDLLRILETVGQAYHPASPCAFRIDLYPQSSTQETRIKFQPVLKSLRGENEIKLLKESGSLRSDSYARDISKEYEDWLSSIDSSPNFRVNIYSFASSLFKTKVILNAAGSEALCEGDFSIAPIKADMDGSYSVVSRMGCAPDEYCFFPNHAHLQSWSTTFCLSEVVPFFRFPVLFDGEVLEIPKETAPRQVEDGLYLGVDRNGYPVNFPLKNMSRHAFFTGMPGSGKTNTMLHLVTQLQKNNIPFLVLEPAKKEYRALLGCEEIQDIHLFSPHLQSHFPLQVNPLEFPKGVRLSEHINALLEVFEGSFVLEGPTFKFLSSSIERSYTQLGWDIEDVNDETCTLPFPTLQDIYDNLQSEIDKSSYDSELKGNVRAFLQVRLGGLMERDAGEVFNAPFSTLAPEEWITSSAIVELEVLSEQSKNFFVLLLCHYILETLRADPNGGVARDGQKMTLRHVIFIEEAHNIIASSTQQERSDSVDPKVSATAYIVKMLAEVRALREAIVIADQLPTALTSEVTKNTGLKLVHRLTSRDDRAQIGAVISASPLQIEQMASFSGGQALIYHEQVQKPFEVQIAEWPAPELSFDIANDAQLYKEAIRYEATQNAVLSAFENWNQKNVLVLQPLLQELSDSLLNLDDTRQSDLVILKSKIQRLLSEYSLLKKKLSRLGILWLSDLGENHPLAEEFNVVAHYLESQISLLDSMQHIV